MKYLATILIIVVCAGSAYAQCARPTDSTYWKERRDTCAPNFSNDPDTLRLVLIVPSVGGGYSWAEIDSLAQLADDSLVALWEREANIYLDVSFSYVREDAFTTSTSDMESYALSPLYAVAPDSQMQVFCLADGVSPASHATVELSMAYTVLDLWGDIRHETGHLFYLKHPHDGVSGVACGDPCRDQPVTYTSITDSVRYVVGDHCADTDPSYAGIDTAGWPVYSTDNLCADSSWITGSTFFPTMNTMSYHTQDWNDFLDFTDDQVTIMRAALVYHLSKFVKQ
jgi:hypothetical protein